MRDVFRPWPGGLRDSNWRADPRTSCARSINMQPTPVAGDDPRSAGGRRRQYFLAPTPGVLTSAPGQWFIQKYPPRGMLTVENGIYIAAGAQGRSRRAAAPAFGEAGSLYQLFGARSGYVGDFAGVADWENDNNAPPLVQMAYGGPQVGILAGAANGKLWYLDLRIFETATQSTTDANRRAALNTAARTRALTANERAELFNLDAAVGWFPDVFGPAGFPSGRTENAQANVIGVQFFNNYFFVLDDENRLFAGPLLGRNTTAQGALEPLERDGMDGQVRRYEFDLTQQLQRSLEPDPWVAMLALSDRLLMFGQRSMGTWQLAADPGDGFPLERSFGGQYQVGVFAQGAIASMGDRAYWVGQTPEGQVRAYRFGGEAGVEPVSTAAVDEYLNTVRQSSRSAARCTATAIAGRMCFAMRFDDYRSSSRRRGLGATWCYDETTGMWHERGVWNAARNTWEQWEVVFAQNLGERPYVIARDASPETLRDSAEGATMVGYLTVAGSWRDAILNGQPTYNAATQDLNLFAGPGAIGGRGPMVFIRRERTTPHWGTRAALQSVRGVKVSMGSGGGDVVLQVSHDGGATFGRSRRLKPGAASGECAWYVCGQGRDPVLRLQMLGSSAALNNIWANVQRLRN